MKNKVLAFVLVLAMIITSASVVSSAAGYDAPLAGGRTQWSADDIMYPGDEGTKYHGAFVQPDVWNPIDGQYEHWTGALFERTTYNGLDCVKISIDPEGSTLVPMLDFNYYQWNAEYYMPSLDATKNCWLTIKYAYNDAASDVSTFKFHASKDVTPLGASVLKNAYKVVDIVNGAGEWQTLTIDLSDMIYEDGTAWNENTVRQFRLQMFEGNEDADAACYIAGFGFFETEAAANAWDFTTTGATTSDTSAADAEAAAKKAAEEAAAKAAAEEAAKKAEAEAAAAAAEAAAAAAEAAAKAAEEAAAAAAAAEADEAAKAAAEEAAKAAEEAAAKAAAAKAEADAAEAAAKSAEDAANAAANAATTTTAAQTSDYTVIAVIASVIALGALVVSKKRFSL